MAARRNPSQAGARAQPWRPNNRASMEPERFHRQVSLVVVGDMGCGKTTLSIRFCSGAFVPVTSTVGYDFHVRSVAARDGRRVQVRIWDTAGQERHRALVPVLFRGVHGCMLVYDCTRRNSFSNVPLWAESLFSMTRTPLPHVLVGNKTDAAGDERQVAIEEGAALARELGAARFFETSAKDGSNVEAAFLALVDAVLAASDAASGLEVKTEETLQLKEDKSDEEKRRNCAC